MPDNIPITAGTGTSVATDDVAGVHYQRIKVTFGAADAAVYASSGAGAVDAGTQRFVLASDAALPLPAGAATQATLAAIDAKLGGTLTVATHAVTQSGGWTVALGAGSATIGAISNTSFGATQSGAWSITNVSGTISLPTGAATAAAQATANSSLAAIDAKLASVVTNTGLANVAAGDYRFDAVADVTATTTQVLLEAPGAGKRIAATRLIVTARTTTPANTLVTLVVGTTETALAVAQPSGGVVADLGYVPGGDNEAIGIKASVADSHLCVFAAGFVETIA